MSVDIEKLCDELNEKCMKLENELYDYRNRIAPKFVCKQKLFCADVVGKEIIEITVQEIVINEQGILYREYVSEDEMRQFNELLCFANREDAEAGLKNFLEAQAN